MAKFKYRMQNILDVKLKLESQAKIAYGVANQKYLDEQKKLQELLIRRAGYEKELKNLMSGIIDVKRISNARADVNAIKTLIRRQSAVVHKAQMELEKARKHLNELMKDRKTHEILKEKAFEEFKQELKAEESKEIDELVSYTYNAR
uniref:flagellar export protein FliJ n=1 Tax=Agathobacter sp. TaxID=2021311 RepID=UPI0040560AFB